MAETTRVPISKSLVLLNASATVGTRLLTFVVFGWALRVLIQQVPREELAILPVVLSVSLFAPAVQSVLTAGLGRFVTEAYACGDSRRVQEILSSLFPLLLAGAIAFLMLSAVVAWWIGWLLSIESSYVGKARFMLMLIAGRISLAIALAAHSTGVIATQEYVRRSQIQVGGAIIQVVLLAALILGIGPEVQFVVVAQTISQLFVIAATCWLSVRLIPMLRFDWAAVDRGTAREVVGYGGWYSMQQFAATIRRAADAPILKRLASPTDVTTFFLGGFVEENIRQFINTASQPLLPALTAMHATHQSHRLGAAYLRGGRLGTWAALFIATPLFVFCDDLLSAYLAGEAENYAEAGVVMRLMLLGFVTTYPSRLIYTISAATGDVRRVAIPSLIIAGVNLALTLLLVGAWGMGAVGSAAATAGAFLVLHPLLIWPIAVRLLKVTWSRFVSQTLLPGLAPALISGLAGWFCQQVFAQPGLYRAAVGSAICVMAYLTTMMAVLHRSDREDLRRVAKRLLGAAATNPPPR